MNVKRILILCGSLVLCLSLVVVLLYAKQEEPPASPTSQEGGETTPAPNESSTTPPPVSTPTPTPPSIIREEKTATAEHTYSGPLVLVDSAYENASLTLRTVPMPAKNPAYTLQAEAAIALEQMMEDYSGYPLSVLYAKGSKEDGAQAICYAGAFSSGLDLCLIGEQDGQTLDFYRLGSGKNWLYRNAWKYGFVPCADTADDWRAGWFRYVGIPHASVMQEQNLTLPDYLATLRVGYTDEEHALVTETESNRYRIFYVLPANDGLYRFLLPQDAVYTLSGDNRGGLVVTVIETK